MKKRNWPGVAPCRSFFNKSLASHLLSFKACMTMMSHQHSVEIWWFYCHLDFTWNWYWLLFHQQDGCLLLSKLKYNLHYLCIQLVRWKGKTKKKEDKNCISVKGKCLKRVWDSKTGQSLISRKIWIAEKYMELPTETKVLFIFVKFFKKTKWITCKVTPVKFSVSDNTWIFSKVHFRFKSISNLKFSWNGYILGPSY